MPAWSSSTARKRDRLDVEPAAAMSQEIVEFEFHALGQPARYFPPARLEVRSSISR
jgi:hypothetical protein